MVWLGRREETHAYGLEIRDRFVISYWKQQIDLIFNVKNDSPGFMMDLVSDCHQARQEDLENHPYLARQLLDFVSGNPPGLYPSGRLFEGGSQDQ